jgi:hypothetical protein
VEKAQKSLNNYKNNQEENKRTECFASVGNSYYEVSQHEKFQFNIHNFKRQFNTDLLDQK